MPSGLLMLSIALDAAAAGVLVYWGVALLRMVVTLLRYPTARHGLTLARRSPPTRSVCVVIPAHNEEVSISHLVETLKAQDYPRFHAVLCLDRCTDRTAEIARALTAGDARFTVLEITDCPEGWAGKVNAVWRGVQTPQARSADLLLFADADTAFHPSCLSATIALLEHRGLHLLSLLSTLTADRWFERLVQPAATFEMVRQYPLSRANRPTPPAPAGRRRAFANGQFMLFTREAYDAVGGHQAVRDELLEDIALARRIADQGRPAGLFLADGILHCRMYETWPQFWRGWKRIYTECAKCKVSRLKRAAAVSATVGAILPAAAAANLVFSSLILGGAAGPIESEALRNAAGAGLWLSAIGLLLFLTVIAAGYRLGRVPLWAIFGYPVGAWMVSRILAEAARDLERGVPIMWAGRAYVRTPR